MKVVEFNSYQIYNAINEQIDFIGKCLKENRKQYIIVPDRFSLSMEKLIMQKLNLTASFDVNVLSISRLAGLVLKDFDGKKVLNMLDAVIIVQYILKKHKDELKCFTKIPVSTGFAKILFDTISQLKSCKITPGMLRYSANKCKSPNLALKILDIATIFDYYENYIKDNFVDSSNKIGLLCEKMAISKIFENADVHFSNFMDFTKQDLDVLENAIKCSNCLSITTISPKEQKNKDVYVSNVINELGEICEKLNVKIDKVVSRDLLTPIQNHICKELFALNNNSLTINGDEISLFLASDAEKEVWFVAKKILEHVSNGAQFSDIIINCCDLKAYESVIENVFTSFNIPFWIDKNISLEKTEYYRFLKYIFDVILWGYQTEDILKVCKNIFSPLTEQEKEIFDLYAKKYGIVGNMWKTEIALKNDDENFLKFNTLKNAFISFIATFENEVKNSKTISDFCFCVRNLIKNYKMQERSEELSVFFENKNNLKQAGIFRQCFDKLEKILSQLESVLGDEQCEFMEWIEIFSVCVASSDISPLPMSLNSVLVGQMLSTIFEPNEYYFVLGASSDKLPAWVKDVGIISDFDIAVLSELNITPTIYELNKKTVFTILQNMTLAEKNLTISMPQNVKSYQNEQSVVLSQLSNMFKIKNGENLPIIEIDKLLLDDNAFGGLKNRFNFLFQSNFDILSWISKNKKFIENNSNDLFKKLNIDSQANYIFNDYDCEKPIHNANKLFFKNDYTKATEVENYFSCPFSHFVMYGLKLKEKEQNKVKPVDIGNILHDVAERYFKFSKGEILNDSNIENFAQKTFDEIISKKQYEHLLFGPQNKALAEGLKKESIRICKALNYHNKHSKYKTKFAEASFGEKDFVPMPEIYVKNLNKTFKLRGKVDRVDFYDKKFRVIDYKTGKNKSEFKMLDFFMGNKLQLFIYLYAIMNGQKDNIPTGAYYFPLRNDYQEEKTSFPFESYCMNGVTIDDYNNFIAQDDLVDYENKKSGIVGFSLDTKKENVNNGVLSLKKNTNLVTQKEMLNMIKYSYELFSNAIFEILSGNINPKPAEGACLYCQSKTFCPYYKKENVLPREYNFKIDSAEIFEEVLKDEKRA